MICSMSESWLVRTFLRLGRKPEGRSQPEEQEPERTDEFVYPKAEEGFSEVWDAGQDEEEMEDRFRCRPQA